MLNISIVLYHPDWQQVAELTQVFLQSNKVEHIYWIDNSPVAENSLPIRSPKISYRHNVRNIGYGAAHNIAIRESIYDDIPYHLVINLDIIVDNQVIETLLAFMDQHLEVGMVMPKVLYPNGEQQYLCKLLPTPLDVFGRRFLPNSWIKRRNDRYEIQLLSRLYPAEQGKGSGPLCQRVCRGSGVYAGRDPRLAVLRRCVSPWQR